MKYILGRNERQMDDLIRRARDAVRAIINFIPAGNLTREVSRGYGSFMGHINYLTIYLNRFKRCNINNNWVFTNCNEIFGRGKMLPRFLKLFLVF